MVARRAVLRGNCDAENSAVVRPAHPRVVVSTGTELLAGDEVLAAFLYAVA
jgi:hypothetical protein